MFNELLKNVMNLGIITEDDVKRLTAIELLLLIIERINGLLLRVNDVDGKLDTFLEDVNKITVEELNKWTQDGTFDSLINQSALKDVNQALDVERTRIDSFTKLNEGSTTGDAELIDARVGANGLTYDTVGGAMRAQIGDIRNTLEEFGLDILESGVYKTVIVESTDRRPMMPTNGIPFKIPAGRTIKYRLTDYTGSVFSKYSIQFYREQGNAGSSVGSGAQSDTEWHEFTNNKDRTYIEVTVTQSESAIGNKYTFELYLVPESEDKNTRISDVINKIEAVEERLTEKIKEIEEQLKNSGGNGGGNGIFINIPNETDTVIKNATVRLALHNSEQEGDVIWNEIFNPRFAQSFDNLGFFDGVTELPFVIQSKGNYDFIRDSKISDANGILHFSDGTLVRSNTSRNKIQYSTNNGETWEDKINGYVARWIDKNDRIIVQHQNNFYRYEKDGMNQTLVLSKEEIERSLGTTLTTPINSPLLRWCEARNSDGTYSVYFGLYLNGKFNSDNNKWTPHAQIYRLNENDNKFTLVYEQIGAEHVHKLSVDTSVVPNIIYAGLDNTATEHGTWIVRSVDGGETWEDISDGNPYPNRDFGWIYSGDGFALSGGEQNILGGETLYKSTNILNEDSCVPVLQTHQGIRDGMTPDNGATILISGVACNTNGIGQIYMSTDNGMSWKTAYSDDFALLTSSTAGNGNRAFTDCFVPMGAKEKQVLYTSAVNVNYGVRCYFGGNRHYALAYVNVGDIPSGGKTIELKTNYLADRGSFESVIDTEIIKPIINITMNEGSGTNTKCNNENIDISDAISGWDDASIECGGMTPSLVANKYALKLKPTSNFRVGNIPLEKIRDFSISFFIKIPQSEEEFDNGKYYILSSEKASIYLENNRICFAFGGNLSKPQLDQQMKLCFGTYQRIMVTVGNEELPTVKVYSYDNKIKETKVSSWGGTGAKFSDFGTFHVGKTSYSDGEQAYPYGICDLKIYDHCLTSEEVRAVYHGRNMVF